MKKLKIILIGFCLVACSSFAFAKPVVVFYPSFYSPLTLINKEQNNNQEESESEESESEESEENESKEKNYVFKFTLDKKAKDAINSFVVKYCNGEKEIEQNLNKEIEDVLEYFSKEKLEINESKEKILNYSTKLKSGEKVLIETKITVKRTSEKECNLKIKISKNESEENTLNN